MSIQNNEEEFFVLTNKNKDLFIKKLQKKYNFDEDFKDIINLMTMEDLISLKLCLSTKSINYKLWFLFDKVVKVSILNVVENFTNDINLKAKLLGVDKYKYKRLLGKYKRK